MDVIAWTRAPSEARAREHGVRFVPLETLLESSDPISLHLALTDETAGLLGAAELDRAKPGMVLVNTARAELVDETALVERLCTGHIGATGIDVYGAEPLAANHPLRAIETAVLTPHIAYDTPEAAAALLDIAIANLEAYYAGTPRNVLAGPAR